MDDERSSSSELQKGVNNIGDLAQNAYKGMDKFNAAKASPSSLGGSSAGANAAASSTAGTAANSTVGAAASTTASSAAGAAASTAASSAAGAAASTAAGAAVGGAAIGSSVGPVGTAVGAVVGALGDKIGKAFIVILLLILLVPYLIFSFPGIMFKTVMEDNPITETVTKVLDAVTGFWDWVTLSGNPHKTYIDSNTSMEDALQLCLANNMTKINDEITADIEAYQYDKAQTTINANGGSDFDSAYILSAYSIQTPVEKQSKDDLFKAFTNAVFYKYSKIEKENVVSIPKVINEYKEVQIDCFDENKKIIKQTLFIVSGTKEIKEDCVVPKYEVDKAIHFTVVNEADAFTTYYNKTGVEKLTLDRKTVKYANYSIIPEYQESLKSAWGFNPYDKFDFYGEESTMTKGEYARVLANNYMLTVYNKPYSGDGIPLGGSSGIGEITYGAQPSYSQKEIIDMVNKLNCSKNRKYLIYTSMTLVGRVPYFWCGRSDLGWNPQWGQKRSILNEGNDKQPVGTMWPYGLDCSGYVSWVYKTVFGGNPLEDRATFTLGNGEVATPIDFKTAKPGDILLRRTHTGIYLGQDPDGNVIVIHEAGTYSGCIISIDNNFTSIIRANNLDLEGNSIPWNYHL